MSEFLHIVDRFVLHFFMSAGVLLLALAVFWYLERKVRWWPSPHGYWFYIVPALLSFMFISFREVFDVAYSGQLVVKAVTDWISWITGLGVSIWALIRLTKRLNMTRFEIELSSRDGKERRS